MLAFQNVHLLLVILFILALKQAIADELADLQNFLDDKAQSSETIVGLSTFLVAGTNDDAISTLIAGKAVLSSAWDLTNKQGISMDSKDVTKETTFMIASVSKLITWTALSMLMDAGKFKLDDPVKKHLSWRFKNKRKPKQDVTYRHLYAHTSGMLDDYSAYLYGDDCPTKASKPYPKSLKTVVKKHAKKKKNWSKKNVGSKYKYSNFATALAAVLVKEHSGMSFTKFTRKYIFEPLEMGSTQYTRPSDGTAAELYKATKKSGYEYKTHPGAYCFPDWPSGQLWTTAEDLAKFSKAMLKRGRLESKTKDGADCLYSEVTGEKVYQKISKDTGDGDSAYGWFVGSPLYKDGAGHDGSETGVSTEFYINLKNNVGVAYLANGELSYKEHESIKDELMSTAKKIGPIDNDFDSSNPKPCTTTLSIDSD